jgi:FAD synthase
MTEENSKKIKKLINGTLFGRMSFKTNKKNNKNIEINKQYKSVLSIGYNPTFNNQTKTIEVFLINFEGGDFYDDEVSLIIDGYSRSEMRFSGLPELVTSITYDTILFNEILENIN